MDDAPRSKIEGDIKIFTNGAWIAVIIGVIIFVLSIIFIGLNSETYNEIGDFIGGVVGSIWALAGLMFLYAGFLSQKEELRLTKKEFQAHTEQFEKQNENLEKQNFESTFFNLITKLSNNFGEFDKIRVPLYSFNHDVRGSEIRNSSDLPLLNLRKLIRQWEINQHDLIRDKEPNEIDLLDLKMTFDVTFQYKEQFFKLLDSIIGYIETCDKLEDKKLYYEILKNSFPSEIFGVFGYYVGYARAKNGYEFYHKIGLGTLNYKNSKDIELFEYFKEKRI